MRKTIVAPVKHDAGIPAESWLNLEDIASVEITSEEAGYPIESAFSPHNEGRGWLAARSGSQTIRVIFDDPQRIKRIWLMFEETEHERTQEFVLRCSPDRGRVFREIVRPQWNFSRPHSVREVENYKVELLSVTMLELIVMPDNRGGEARASILKLLVA